MTTTEPIRTVDITDMTEAEIEYLFAMSADPTGQHDATGVRPEVATAIAEFVGTK